MQKSQRVLDMFYRLLRGEKVDKYRYAEEYEMSVRSVERDARTIRDVLEGWGDRLEIDGEGHYYLKASQRREFTEMEVLFIAKVLLGSRTLCGEEMVQILRGMNALFPIDIRHEIKSAIQSELEQYVGPQHGKKLLRRLWELNHAMQKQLKIALVYRKISGEEVRRKVLPVSVVSSECYLYLVGFFEEKAYPYPAFFRLDRIVLAEVTAEHYNPKLFSACNMGRMKKCIQFMYAGELMHVKLACLPHVVEPVRDRLPNSRVVGHDGERTILTAKVFGEGFGRWALPYGAAIEVLEPKALREEIAAAAKAITAMYEADT
ncbi:MAG: helix-turn-helix transcriptional regulator [Schwartzia sp. (in: firmicutes)]